jgi:hypothetical protein
MSIIRCVLAVDVDPCIDIAAGEVHADEASRAGRMSIVALRTGPRIARQIEILARHDMPLRQTVGVKMGR